jgi:hypothetical protein
VQFAAVQESALAQSGQGQKAEATSREARPGTIGESNQNSRPKNPNHTLATTAMIKMQSVTYSAKAIV